MLPWIRSSPFKRYTTFWTKYAGLIGIVLFCFQVFPPGFPLVHNLSTAILDVTGGDEGSQIEAKWFGTTAAPPSYAIPNTDSTPLTLRSFSGLFVITGCISALMLMISISKSVLASYTRIRDSDVRSPDADGGNGGREECNSAQNVMGDGYVDDRPHHEIRIDSSQDIHGISVERADGEEPGPIQNGSVPANSSQTR